MGDIDYQNLNNILLIRIDQLGDLILTLPAVFALKKRLPKASLSLVINAKNISLVKGLPYIDRVIAVEPNRRSTIFQAVRDIRKNRYNIAIQLLPGNDPCGSFLAVASRAKYKIGYGVGFFSIFFSHRIKPCIPRYELENVMDIIKTVIPDLKFYGWGLDANISSIAGIDGILNKIGVNDSRNIIVIHPGVSRNSRNKMWPVERLVDLIRKIDNMFKVKIFIIGTDDEKKITRKIKEEIESVFDLSGQLSLNELVALIKQSRLFIGSNSGPLQIAVALDIPTVSLMGPSLFQRWAPKGDRHIVIQKKADCIPCEGTGKKCSDNICMKMISVEEVYEAVKSQVGKE